MRKEEIETYASPALKHNTLYQFHLHSGKLYVAAFVYTEDYHTLRSFNTWRLVLMTDLQLWVMEKDLDNTFLLDGDLVREVIPVI